MPSVIEIRGLGRLLRGSRAESQMDCEAMAAGLLFGLGHHKPLAAFLD